MLIFCSIGKELVWMIKKRLLKEGKRILVKESNGVTKWIYEKKQIINKSF